MPGGPRVRCVGDAADVVGVARAGMRTGGVRAAGRRVGALGERGSSVARALCSRSASLARSWSRRFWIWPRRRSIRSLYFLRGWERAIVHAVNTGRGASASDRFERRLAALRSGGLVRGFGRWRARSEHPEGEWVVLGR